MGSCDILLYGVKMRLSIFPEVEHLPKSKEEKHQASKKASICRVVSADNDSQLFKLVCNHAWSPFLFENNKRLASNFISTDFLVFDIDEGMTIDAAAEIVENEKLCALILPSTSHSPEAHRFRIILPLARTISSVKSYQDTWAKGAELFGVVDEQCKDTARFFFSCRDDDGFWLEGDLFSPIALPERVIPTHVSSSSMITVTEDISELVLQIYGERREKIPEAVEYFIKNAESGIPGNWTNSLNAFCFSLILSGVESDMVEDLCEQLAPNPLDSKDLYQINRSIKDGKASI
jgi:hypothetical protein